MILVRLKLILAAILLPTLITLSYTEPIYATDANSTNWGVSEVNFGSGGSLNSCSTLYCSKQSAGELTVGETSSTNYKAQGGFNNEREPFLEVVSAGGPVDLGMLDETVVKTGSTTFSVKTYLASGYDVVVDGTAPKNKLNGHILTPMTVAGVSAPGQEQFGINLRQNTSPSVGSDVYHSPESSFGFGASATGYGTQNNFKFASGDLIAASPKSSGTSTFTMSMIANIGTTSPAGAYGGRLTLIVVPTF